MRFCVMVAALALVACGDAVVERGYQGEPVFQFTGEVMTAGQSVQFAHPLRATAFWSTETEEASALSDDDLVEHDALSVQVAFPGVYHVNVFDRPPPMAWEDPESGYRVAFLVLCEDVNGDGRCQRESEVRGAATGTALLYVERPLVGVSSPTGKPLDPGYHVVRLPMPCPWLEVGEAPHVEPMLPPTCAVPVGAACGSDADCGGGVCLTSLNGRPWLGGYCSVPATDPACAGLGVPVVEAAQRWVLAPCEDDDDCRLEDGFACLGAPGAPLGCSVAAPPALELGEGVLSRIGRVCAEETESGS